jgi:hypothetical protein
LQQFVNHFTEANQGKHFYRVGRGEMIFLRIIKKQSKGRKDKIDSKKEKRKDN